MRFELELTDEVKNCWNDIHNDVVKYPDGVLRKKAVLISKPNAETRVLVDKMKKTMSEANGVGFAAPQIGVSQRVIIYRLPGEDQPTRIILNPRIISMKGEQVGLEGCLSIPLLEGDVKRAYEVIVKGMDMLGRPFRRRATEMEARVIQHEIDHLDGVLFIDRADPETLKWHLPVESESGDPELALD